MSKTLLVSHGSVTHELGKECTICRKIKKEYESFMTKQQNINDELVKKINTLKEPKPKVRKMNFNKMFKLNGDGTIKTLKLFEINGVRINPGVDFGFELRFGGINLSDYIDQDFQVEEKDGVLKIIGIYLINKEEINKLKEPKPQRQITRRQIYVGLIILQVIILSVGMLIVYNYL